MAAAGLAGVPHAEAPAAMAEAAMPPKSWGDFAEARAAERAAAMPTAPIPIAAARAAAKRRSKHTVIEVEQKPFEMEFSDEDKGAQSPGNVLHKVKKFNMKSKKAEEERQKIIAEEARLRANKEKRAAEREELSKTYKGYQPDFVADALEYLDEAMNRSTKRAHDEGVRPVSKRKVAKDDEEMASSSKRTAEEREETAAKRKKDEQRLLALANIKLEPRAKPEVKAKPEPKAKARVEPVRQVGVEVDQSKDRKYWKSRNMAYIKTQYELLGGKIDKSLLTGTKEEFDNILGRKVKTKILKITKNELLDLLYQKLKI